MDEEESLEPPSKRQRLGYSSWDYPLPIVGTMSTRATDEWLGCEPGGIAVDHRSGDVFVAGFLSFKNGLGSAGLIQRISPDGKVTALAGKFRASLRSDGILDLGSYGAVVEFADGVGEAATFQCPAGLALSGDGLTLFVADRGNHRIRQIDITSRTVSTLAGSGDEGDQDGVGEAASFASPQGLALSGDGFTLFVADKQTDRYHFNSRIRQIDITSRDGVITHGQRGTNRPQVP